MRHWGSRAAVEQLPLFKRLPIPRGAVPWHRRRYPRPPAPSPAAALQLAFEFRLRKLERDIDTAFDFPAQSIVLASSAGAYATDAPRSVFDLHRRPLMGSVGFGGTGLFSTEPKIVRKVEVADGVTRIVGAAFPVRWTAEDEERERVRRAKQRPPKPTRKAKTRSRKLMDMIGVDDGDE